MVDAADTKAIRRALQRPRKVVAVRTEMQQTVLMAHRQREQLVKPRTMQVVGPIGWMVHD